MKIDLVLPWVNGSDPTWLSRYKEYTYLKGDSRPIRFRDWDILKYWFRAVEEFAPWFNKIFFITSGELPEWINLKHPKLSWIKHEDYIPQEYLPTFNVNTIELNLHRIEDLSEHFIYFNDDTFLIRPVDETVFFKNNLPCDMAVLTAKPSGGGIVHMAINDLDVLDRNFNKHTVIGKNPAKWFNLKYGKGYLNNLLLYPWKEFSGFIDPHMPNSFLKSVLSEIWEKEYEVLDNTCKSRFRTNDDVNQWLIRYWQLAKGCFNPINKLKRTTCTDLNESTVDAVCEIIRQQKYDMVCLNDNNEIEDFESVKNKLQSGLQKILPHHSLFEKL